MTLNGVPATHPAVRRLLRLRDELRAAAPGLALCGTIAMASTFVSDHYGGPVMLFALLIGMAFNFLTENERVGPGLTMAAKGVLRLGVALSAARITAHQVAALGISPVVAVIAGILATFAFGHIASRRLGLHREFGALSSTAVAICGVSAALTAASVLPKRSGLDKQTALVALMVTSLSTIAMILYPPLTAIIGLDPSETGIFLGGSIHDVAQVVGAGYLVSDMTGDVATVTKLFRVAMLVPVSLCLAVVAARWLRQEPDGAEAGSRPRIGLPWFLTAFVAIVAINTAGLIPSPVATGLADFSRVCLIVAIAAIGVRTSLKEMASLGWKPAALIVGQTAVLAIVVLLGIEAAS